jgi:thiol-disulfide isomerase/thioredoxin
MKKQIFNFVFAVGLAAASMIASASESGAGIASYEGDASSSPAGTWIGTADVNGHSVPWRLELSVTGGGVRGALVNGKERSASSSGSYADGHLVLSFDYYANTLDATVKDGVLSGTFSGRGRSVPVTAHLHGKEEVSDPGAPHIAGTWDVAVQNGAKGEHSWKLRVRQEGPRVVAVIERIDGDTGNLYGEWRNGAFEVSHFTAAGPSFAVLRPQADGSLTLETAAHGGGLQSSLAHREPAKQNVGLSGADDPLHHTYLKDPDRPLAFSFRDLNGKLVSNTDSQFAHKVVIVSIGGSWCPNCQDEAPFFEELYRKYHSQGLEIVELSFEEEAQLQNPVRLRAVIQRYGITYPVLVAGTPDQLNEKIQHVANLDCWPTTFFVGKDGLVKATHTGYAGPATGTDNRKLEDEVTEQVKRLLAENDVKPGSKLKQVASVR